MTVPVTYQVRDVSFLDEASKLVEKVFREEFDIPLASRLEKEAREIRARLDESRDLFMAAETGGRLAGALVVAHEETASDSVLFWCLIVDAAARGRGIGRELLFRGMETCRQRGLVLLRAHSFAFSPAAPHLYWMHGFRVAGMAAVEIAGRPREALFFEKRLTPAAAP